MYLLNDEDKIKSLRQSWELAKNRLVTNSFLKEEAVCVCVSHSVGLQIKKMKYEPVFLKPFPILSFSWVALGAYPLFFSTFWLCLK